MQVLIYLRNIKNYFWKVAENKNLLLNVWKRCQLETVDLISKVIDQLFEFRLYTANSRVEKEFKQVSICLNRKISLLNKQSKVWRVPLWIWDCPLRMEGHLNLRIVPLRDIYRRWERPSSLLISEPWTGLFKLTAAED